MKVRNWVVAAWLLAMSSSPLAAGIDGAYERISLINTRTGESPEAANRQGLLIIAHGHYAMLTMNPERRVLARDVVSELPQADKLAYLEEWLDVNAHSGRIDIDGDKLVWHRQISEDPREVGTTSKLGWRAEENTLILSFTLPNGDRYDWTWRRIAD